ncbi:uncharacterized protein LOC129971884 isoform X2 [Argiope bruennichi]|uniref:uncharacterized protein LOC129971884 isoform X2 n=1 Tax=Argiope bruennichi TaxID=94029 RepID=UPI00249584B9|nr:uncharacterized protein LOC129971884 isoform X2 [Argiope bruennichi]
MINNWRDPSGMAERRISGWFVLSAVFIVAVFGLFFTFTERKTWPEQRTELSAADMRLVPPSSTLWCEAVALTSDHPFVAYQVSLPPLIEPKHLNKQRVNLNLKLNGGQSGNVMKLRYYLLPASIVEISACATHPGGRLLVFKGDKEVTSCLKQQCGEDSDESDSDEDSSADSSKCSWSSKTSRCSSLVSNSVISSSDVREESSYMCDDVHDVRPVHVNITSADFYVIVILNTNRHRSNAIGLRIVLDRSRYTIHKSGHTFDMCSLSTACTIGLSFASSDRALVWIPDEPNAGRSTFTIRSQCKPRLAVFAILSVFFPLIVFLGVAFVVRADRDRIMRIYSCRGRLERERQERSDSRFVAPLLDDAVAGSGDFTHFHTREAPQTPTDEQPPPYHTLYDPPPPYACVKEDENNK